MSDLKHEIMLQVGAEGGTISLLRTRNSDGTLRFHRKTNESFHAGMLSVEDQNGLSYHSQDDAEGSFLEAVSLLKEYPWHRLQPLKVHPRFRKTIYEKVIELSKKDEDPNNRLREWKTLCGMPSD